MIPEEHHSAELQRDLNTNFPTFSESCFGAAMNDQKQILIFYR